MSAAITVYTTCADVRAALGVSDDDIEDATLGLDLYEISLEAELEDIDINLPATFATKAALPTPSTAETRFLQSTRIFATYALAKQLATSLPIFAAKQYTDGKASVQRFDNPYKDTIASVNSQYDRYKNRLAQTLAAIGTATATATALTFLSVVSPATDPVTGV